MLHLQFLSAAQLLKNIGMKVVENVNWNYKQPVEIIFGSGKLSELKKMVEKANAPLLVSDPSFVRNGLAGKIRSIIGGEVFGNIDKSRCFRSKRVR